MNNLISIFTNYKITRLCEYGIFLYQEDTPFLRKVMKEYFSVYIDNHYYSIFHTIDDTISNEINLELEFKGIMKDMLEDYAQYELVEGNEEYREHINAIQNLKDFSLSVLKIDALSIPSKEEVSSSVTQFVEKNVFYKEKVGKRLPAFIKLVKETYQVTAKLWNYPDHYFQIHSRSFVEHPNLTYVELDYNIATLNSYRKSMVERVYQREKLEKKKLECLVQKLSLMILKNWMENNTSSKWMIELDDSFVKRGKIEEEVYQFIDNPLFRKYVTLGVSYQTYQNQKSIFEEDFHFACIQDFTHINDIFQKVDSISKEGVFDYLIVWDCKYKDRDYFLKYEEKAMKVLVFEEE